MIANRDSPLPVRALLQLASLLHTVGGLDRVFLRTLDALQPFDRLNQSSLSRLFLPHSLDFLPALRPAPPSHGKCGNTAQDQQKALPIQSSRLTLYSLIARSAPGD